MTNKRKSTRGVTAPASLVALAIAPILLGSCLTKSDRETVEIPPVPVGQPVNPLEQAPVDPSASPLATAEPGALSYSLDDAVKYEVASGDTLGAIATKHGVSMAAVKAANNITDINKIKAGDILLLPGPKTATEGETPAGATDGDATPAVTPTPPAAGAEAGTGEIPAAPNPFGAANPGLKLPTLPSEE